MFKRSKRKIVGAIMAVLTILFLGTLLIIFSFSYLEVSASNREMLERYAELYSLENQPGKEVFSAEKGEPHSEDTPAFQLSTFYSVALSETGEMLAIDNDGETVFEDAVLVQAAKEILGEGKSRGVKGNLIYLAVLKEDYTLVAFMDNTLLQQSMTTLFRYTLVFGSLAMLLLFFVALFLADRIVSPLEKSYQRQKQFISDAGHELKTPVAVIGANLELLTREMGENRWLSNIQYENESMGRLVDQLLSLSRMETVSSRQERLDLSRLTVGETLPFESVAFEQGFVLNSSVEEGLYVEGNALQLKQLIGILLDNAISYSRGREIWLSLESDHGQARLTVVNEGEEIPAEEQAALFERFYRGDKARSSQGKHYGLGLAIARAVVTAHKGKMNLLCHDGKVEFTVLLPCQK